MAQAASKTCEICVSAPGSCYCLDCEQYFCENCKVLHLRQKISTSHKFTETSDFIPEVKSKCTDHNEVFSFVCIACDVPVCVCCVTEKHNGHKLSKLKDTIAQLETNIEEEVLKKLNKTSGTVFKLEQNISSFNVQVETVIQSITEEGNKIKSMVDQYTANKIAILQEQARKESEQLAAALSGHKTALDKAYALENRKRSIGEQSRHDGTLIKMLKNLHKDIDKLEVCPLPEFPSVTYNPIFVEENNISQLFGSYILCETKIRRERKFEFQPNVLVDGQILTCKLCGNRKIMKYIQPYPRGYFTCCNIIMD